MSETLIFFIQLTLLFLLARSFAKNFYRFWFLVLKSPHWASRLTSFFLFPGTLIHELAHWLVAEVLQVRTGKISLWPQQTADGDLKLGSVEIVKTDPFRRTIIGLAPLVVGMSLIVITGQFMPAEILACRERGCLLAITVGSMVIFLISNTMFSSKKDLEAALVPVVLLSFMMLAWWYLAWPIPETVFRFGGNLVSKLTPIFTLTILINVIILSLTKLLMAFFGKILNRRVVEQIS